MNFFAVYAGAAGRSSAQRVRRGWRFGGKLVSNSSGEVLMVLHVCAKVSAVRFLTGLVFVFAACGFAVRGAYAVQCAVVHHGPPSDADKAYLAADYKTAENLYRAQLAANPANSDVTAGLVHSLLQEQKIQEAADAVNAALAANPHSPALITLRGEVELRQGEPWTALGSAGEAFKLDPCNPRMRLLLANLSAIDSYYASARNLLVSAHALDPEDQEIRREWIETLPQNQQITELKAYLATPRGDDADTTKNLRKYLDNLTSEAGAQLPKCELASATPSTEIPFTDIMADATHVAAFGLEVKLNGHDVHLEIDTGASGLAISRTVAKRAGLKQVGEAEISGIGDQKASKGYQALVDSIRIGGIEFKNCVVSVIDSPNVIDVDGLIGMGVFSQFLVTLDYPGHKLLLDSLPPRPGESGTAAPALNTVGEVGAGSPFSAAAVGQPGTSSAAPEFRDRYVAPEMKDYTHVYRIGSKLLLPVRLNDKANRLFAIDTGSWETTLSVQAGDVTFRFAQLSERDHHVYTFDTSNISREMGMEISGFLGSTTLELLTIHIDYRDGLVKFDYDPKRVPRADYRNGLVR
jgi:tetratricopeptide (TPR) repeat protein